MASEVPCPIFRFRIDVAGYLDRAPPEGQRSLFAAAEQGFAPAAAVAAARQKTSPGPRSATVFIECKQSRTDFLRDCRQLEPLLRRREKLERDRADLEENWIKQMEPELRAARPALFTELEEWDFGSSRLASYRAVIRELEDVDRRLHGETKFCRMSRYALADYLYLAAPSGVIARRELPGGWGLIECGASALEGGRRWSRTEAAESMRVVVDAPLTTCSDRHRSRALRNIAAAATRCVMRSGVGGEGAVSGP